MEPAAAPAAADIAFYEAPADVAIDVGSLSAAGPTSGAMSSSAAAAKLPPAPGLPAFPEDATGMLVSSMLRGARAQINERGISNIHARIDDLRPHFDVETREVPARLLWALHPSKGEKLIQQGDLYVPTLLGFTLAAALVWGMKASHAGVSAGNTVIGTALATAFFYWAAAAVLLLGCAYALQVRLRPTQALCLTGYALVAVDVALVAALAPHAGPFWVAFIVLGGASAASLGRAAASLAESPRHGAALAAIAAALPLLFALYCRRAFFP